MSTANLAQYGVSQGNIRQLFGEALVALGRTNPNVVVLDCQTAMPTAAVTFARAFPDRFIDLAIAEQNAVSFAAGLARMGFVPILPLFACFSSRRALDQVTIQAGYAGLNVKVCGLYAGLTSPNTGATHQMISDLAVMRSIPNMTVVEPADALEMSQALPVIVAHQGPVYFRLVRGDVGGPCPRVVPRGDPSDARALQRMRRRGEATACAGSARPREPEPGQPGRLAPHLGRRARGAGFCLGRGAGHPGGPVPGGFQRLHTLPDHGGTAKRRRC